jgi:hypothetical protein
MCFKAEGGDQNLLDVKTYFEKAIVSGCMSSIIEYRKITL